MHEGPTYSITVAYQHDTTACLWINWWSERSHIKLLIEFGWAALSGGLSDLGHVIGLCYLRTEVLSGFWVGCCMIIGITRLKVLPILCSSSCISWHKQQNSQNCILYSFSSVLEAILTGRVQKASNLCIDWLVWHSCSCLISYGVAWWWKTSVLCNISCDYCTTNILCYRT